MSDINSKVVKLDTGFEGTKLPEHRNNGGDFGDGGGGGMSNYITRDELHRELNHFETKIDKKFLELQLELKKQQSTNIKWIVGTAIALAGVIIAAIEILG